METPIKMSESAQNPAVLAIRHAASAPIPARRASPDEFIKLEIINMAFPL
jgi:hypothetical protein